VHLLKKMALPAAVVDICGTSSTVQITALSAAPPRKLRKKKLHV